MAFYRCGGGTQLPNVWTPARITVYDTNQGTYLTTYAFTKDCYMRFTWATNSLTANYQLTINGSVVSNPSINYIYKVSNGDNFTLTGWDGSGYYALDIYEYDLD